LALRRLRAVFHGSSSVGIGERCPVQQWFAVAGLNCTTRERERNKHPFPRKPDNRSPCMAGGRSDNLPPLAKLGTVPGFSVLPEVDKGEVRRGRCHSDPSHP